MLASADDRSQADAVSFDGRALLFTRLDPRDWSIRAASRWVAKFRVQLIYLWRHGRWPDLGSPKAFTECLQHRKLYNRDPALARLTDKLIGKQLALSLIGPTAVIPTLWTGTVLPASPPGELPLIVKANHGCGQNMVVRTAQDWQAARKRVPHWLKRAYGGWLDEWHYRSARRMLLIEPFLGEADQLPHDYKIYVFGGRAQLVQVHIGRGSEAHRWIQFDRLWRRRSTGSGDLEPSPPQNLDRMLQAAEAMASGHDFLRVDFYEIDGVMLFGEMCLFPGSGLDRFDPVSLDLELGALWPETLSAPSVAGAEPVDSRSPERATV